MEKKSYISVKYATMLALIVIIIIGIISVTSLLLPSFSNYHCIQAQFEHIDYVNDIAEDVKTTGETQTVKMKVEGLCVEYMFYNDTGECLEVKFSTENNTTSVSTPLPWNIQGNCAVDSKIVGGKVYTLEVNPNSINIVGC